MDLRGRRGVAAALVVGTALAGCGAAGADVRLPANVAADAEPRQVALRDASAVPDVVEAVGDLGVGLLRAAPEDGNALVSPVGVAVTLSMLAEGASGRTAAELDAALGAEGKDRTDAVNALLGALAEHDGDPELIDPEALPDTPFLHLANGIVVDDGVVVAEDYLIDLREGYDAAVAVTDLASEEGKAELDGWVRHHTGGLVERSAVEPDEGLVVVLQNAVLLAARWSAPFVTTETETFTLATGEGVPVDMMRNVQEVRHARTPDVEVVRLPYSAALVMDVALPAPGVDVSDALDVLDRALGSATPASVAVSMPRLDLRAGTDLTDALAPAGVSRVFTGAAELDRIAPGVTVGQAVHQMRLVVDEEGTLAAATTEMGMAGSAAPDPVSFVADRPFALRIVDVRTHLPIFMGLVRDPSSDPGGHGGSR